MRVSSRVNKVHRASVPSRTPLPEHAGIVIECLQLPHHNLSVVSVHRINQAIIFTGSDNGRHKQQTMFRSSRESIPEPRQFRRRCGLAPARRQLCGLNRLARQIVRHFGNCQYQIIGRIVFVKMDEIFEHCQRLMFGCITQAGSNTRPAATVAVSSLAVKRRAGISPA